MPASPIPPYPLYSPREHSRLAQPFADDVPGRLAMREEITSPELSPTSRHIRDTPDAVVVGAGPNGLAAAIELARERRSVLVLEASARIGGGCRSAALTLPGFVHDVCSATHPLALASPFFRTLDLPIEWIQPPLPLAHPLDDGSAVVLERSVGDTAAGLGDDARAYRALYAPLVARADALIHYVQGPFRIPFRHPFLMLRFALLGLRSATTLANATFRGERARAIFAGMCAHSMLRLDQSPSASAGMLLALLAHAVGWPVPRGGSQRLSDALADALRARGGAIHCGEEVQSLDDLPSARAYLCDVTPRQLLGLAGMRFPPGYRRALARYRYGPGVFKIDYALDGPVPWRAPACARAGTVHLGGTLEEIARSEDEVARGTAPARPFVLVAQQSLFDASRAPKGKQTLWAYCHVPNGASFDMTDRIEAQLERFAPGFKDRVLARHVTGPSALEAYNRNYVGGDINGGIQDLRQLFTRPVARLVPYSTPARGIYICSSSTPPGGGVHGMCGYFAARAALRVIR